MYNIVNNCVLLLIFTLHNISKDETGVLKSPAIIVLIPLWHFRPISVCFIKFRATIFTLYLYMFMYYVCWNCVSSLCPCVHVCASLYLCMCKEAKGGHRAWLHETLLYFLDRESLIQLGGRLATSKSHWSSYLHLPGARVTASTWDHGQIFTWLGIQTQIKQQAFLSIKPSLQPLSYFLVNCCSY